MKQSAGTLLFRDGTGGLEEDEHHPSGGIQPQQTVEHSER